MGVVRNDSDGKEVKSLDYEVYEKMALKELEVLGNYCLKKWNIQNILIHHRKGRLKVGDVSVVIIVSAKHREDTFLACGYAIDKLKKNVPIWKKEIFVDGEEWVTDHA